MFMLLRLQHRGWYENHEGCVSFPVSFEAYRSCELSLNDSRRCRCKSDVERRVSGAKPSPSWHVLARLIRDGCLTRQAPLHQYVKSNFFPSRKHLPHQQLHQDGDAQRSHRLHHRCRQDNGRAKSWTGANKSRFRHGVCLGQDYGDSGYEPEDGYGWSVWTGMTGDGN